MVETKKLSNNDGQRTVELESFSEKMHVLKCLVHCADLSNPTRPRQYYEEWVDRLMEEFFKQVDNLPLYRYMECLEAFRGINFAGFLWHLEVFELWS